MHRNVKELAQDYTASKSQNQNSNRIRLALYLLMFLIILTVFLEHLKNYLKHLSSILFTVTFSEKSSLEGLSWDPEPYNLRIP